MSQKCYYNGNIITLENELYKDCLLIENDKIICVGKINAIKKYTYDDVEMIDLEGKTLMPSFIDTHSHFISYANSFLEVNLSFCRSFDDIKHKILEFKLKHNIQIGQWITAYDYNENFIKEKKHPTKDFLDGFLADNPILLKHQSGHCGIFNKKAIKILNIQHDNNGFLEEKPFIDNIQKVPMPSIQDFTKAILKTQTIYARHGITTMQESMLVDSMLGLISLILQCNLLKLDLIGYANIKNGNEILYKFDETLKKYSNRLKINGYNIFLDGDIKNKTAYLTKKYENTDNKGLQYYNNFDLITDLNKAIDDNFQISAHCIGNEAIQQFVDCYKKALDLRKTKSSIRPIILHSQLLKHKQLDNIKLLKMIPSFDVTSLYYCANNYINNLGLDRAKNLNLIKSVANKNINYTIHQNSHSKVPNILEIVWCAVNRISKDNNITYNNEKISVLEAFKAITKYAAFQHFEETTKGSLKEGKLADLVILDKNPLDMNPLDIRDVRVLETIKEGKTVYKL